MNFLTLKALNLLNTKKAKLLFLAGLIGLVSSCKIDEPEKPENFMQGMSSAAVNEAVFYPLGESTKSFSFQNKNNAVTGVTILEDVKDDNVEIYNPVNLTRTSESFNNNRKGCASFVSPEYWEYVVGTNKEPVVGWGIHYVTGAEYDSKYKKMTNQELADVATSRIESKKPEDVDYLQNIHDAILGGLGSWNQKAPLHMEFVSKGQANYSDFGEIYLFNQKGGNPAYDAGDAIRIYSGGMISKKISKSMVKPQTFEITVIGYVEYNHDIGVGMSDRIGARIETEYNAAKLTVKPDGTKVLYMPFNNWYEVTITVTDNSVVSDFKGNSPRLQLMFPSVSETSYRQGVQENGLTFKYGEYETENQKIITTGTSTNFYSDEKGPVEVSGQGYRSEKFENRRVNFYFVYGGKGER